MEVVTRRLNIAELSPKDWHSIDQVLAGSANATVFHTVEWNQLLVEQFDLQNITLLATISEVPVGLYSIYALDRHVCRSPAIHLQTTYGGPLSIENDPEVVTALVKEAERLQPVTAFEIWTPPNYDITPFLKLGYLHVEMYTPVVNLQFPEEGLWAGVDGKKRNVIRKAIRNGVAIIEGDAAALDEYHGMVVGTLSRAQIDVLPKVYYRRILESLGSRRMARLFLATHKGSTIAGALILAYKDTVYGWDMGWRRDYISLGANDLLNWEVIKWARRKGYKYFDLLRLDPDHLPGVARWKETFGGDSLVCYYVQRATSFYRLWRGLNLIKNPRRAFQKLSSYMEVRLDAH